MNTFYDPQNTKKRQKEKGERWSFEVFPEEEEEQGHEVTTLPPLPLEFIVTPFRSISQHLEGLERVRWHPSTVLATKGRTKGLVSRPIFHLLLLDIAAREYHYPMFYGILWTRDKSIREPRRRFDEFALCVETLTIQRCHLSLSLFFSRALVAIFIFFFFFPDIVEGIGHRWITMKLQFFAGERLVGDLLFHRAIV